MFISITFDWNEIETWDKRQMFLFSSGRFGWYAIWPTQINMWPWLGVPWGQRYQVTFVGQRVGHVAHNLNERTILTPTPRLYLNSRPVGFWRVTHSVGEGGVSAPPCDLSNYWTDFQNSCAIRYPWTWTFRSWWEIWPRCHWWCYRSDQSRNVRYFGLGEQNFDIFVTSASKISMLSANKATLQMSLTFVIISSCALWPYYGSRSSQVTM